MEIRGVAMTRVTEERALGAQELRLVACQASIYTSGGEVGIGALLRGLAPMIERFNTEPEVVSHPASPHPRILLRSETGMWRWEIAADRADFYWLRPEARAPAPSVEDVYQIAPGLLGTYAEVSGSRIGRLAAIVKRVAVAPAAGAVGHFLRPELADAFEGTEMFELYTHRRQALDHFIVNASLRCSAGGGGALVVDQDVNTLAEQAAARRFTTTALAEFFACAAREHERMLRRYFPEPS